MNTDLPLSKPSTRNNIFWISWAVVTGHGGKNELLSVINVTAACIILLKSYLIYHILISDTAAGMLWVRTCRTSCLVQLALHISQHCSEIRNSTSQNLSLMNCSWHFKWYSSCKNSTNVHNRNATRSSSMFVFSLGLCSAVSFLSNGCNDHHLCGIVGKVIVHLQTSTMWKQTTPSEKEIKCTYCLDKQADQRTFLVWKHGEKRAGVG